jgi:hypothetical protein
MISVNTVLKRKEYLSSMNATANQVLMLNDRYSHCDQCCYFLDVQT